MLKYFYKLYFKWKTKALLYPEGVEGDCVTVEKLGDIKSIDAHGNISDMTIKQKFEIQSIINDSIKR